MVAAIGAPTGRLAETLESLFGQLVDPSDPTTKVALVLVDGLGAELLADHSGHARTLTSMWAASGSVLNTGLPSTTAAALASITTGATSGQHGLLGYQVRDPASGEIVNHLKPFPLGVEPESWQPMPTIFQRAAELGIDSIAVAEARFAGTDFSRAILRGARMCASHSLENHLLALREFFDSRERGLAYLYWPGLDRVGHHRGVHHESWRDQLEQLDVFVAHLGRTLRPGERVVLTADHGMLDVPREHHVVMPAEHPLRQQLAGWAGEPRFVHLYLASGLDVEVAKARWQDFVGERARVWDREQAIAADFFGPVAVGHRERIGDLVVLARHTHALYDELTATPASREMVGQHGSDSPDETLVPLIELS